MDLGLCGEHQHLIHSSSKNKEKKDQKDHSGFVVNLSTFYVYGIGFLISFYLNNGDNHLPSLS